MDNLIFFPIVCSLLTVIYAFFLILKLHKLPAGSKEMKEIAKAIAEGANAYLKRQSQTIAILSFFLFILISLVFSFTSALAFAFGAFLSALAGYIGMKVAVLANVRTTEAAKKGLAKALSSAFAGGSVTGLLVGGLALFAVSLTSYLTIGSANLQPLIALGFGASLISVFARLGGGIYTKAADVGTDMVGKIEKGIPEDDPRNPGVIADLVGDNVGDDAGMAADLFETYVVTAVAAILLASLKAPDSKELLVFPLLIGGTALLASIIGTFFVRTNQEKNIMSALYKGLAAAIFFSAIALYFIVNLLPTPFSSFSLFTAGLVGYGVTLGMMAITEYFTSKNYSPVKNIAQASLTGHGTNVIAGLAISMKATFLPILLISLATLTAYSLAGLYGIAVSAMAMLSLTGIIISIDAFGPITDNAGGIAEMSNQPEEVRKVTDALDAVGNTTKAVTKAYAIASAGLAALVLFASYTQEITSNASQFFSLSEPAVLVGLFLGASLPYLFASFAMEAVGKTAQQLVIEIRRQFREIKGIMQGRAKPQYGRAVDIVAKAALFQMIVPAALPVIAPILVAFALGAQALGGLLMGTLITGLFVALSMTTGGAAWDNAKKYIEGGHLGGKGSLAHQAAVTGDTVGDPYKDTAGPAINPMIKVVNIVALLLASFLK